MMANIRNDCEQRVIRLQEHHDEVVEQVRKQLSKEILTFKVITWLKEFVRERYRLKVQSEKEEIWQKETQRLTRFMDANPKSLTVDDVLHLIDKMGAEEVELVKGRFRAEIEERVIQVGLMWIGCRIAKRRNSFRVPKWRPYHHRSSRCRSSWPSRSTWWRTRRLQQKPTRWKQ